MNQPVPTKYPDNSTASYTLFPQKLTPLIKTQLTEPAIARQFIEPETDHSAHPGSVNTPAATDGLPTGFSHDAVADKKHLVHRGVIHKYRNRILLIASSHCAVHCRYCFRQHFDYEQQTFDPEDLPVLMGYLERHPEIDEVILSGGDPLTLKNTQLDAILECLNECESVKRIRIHSRVLTTLPERLNNGLISILWHYRHKLILVMHINHASELVPKIKNTIRTVRDLEVKLLNQSVLLRGVNDDAHCLHALSEALFALGIMPYYLNLLDKVKGAERFYVPDDEAEQIYRELAAMTSGYLLPKLVRDTGEGGFKRIVGL